MYDKQVDFNTLDLLTKRYNSREKCSPLSKMVFDDLNRISEIPIHRTSNKGSVIIYHLGGGGGFGGFFWAGSLDF